MRNYVANRIAQRERNIESYIQWSVLFAKHITDHLTTTVYYPSLARLLMSRLIRFFFLHSILFFFCVDFLNFSHLFAFCLMCLKLRYDTARNCEQIHVQVCESKALGANVSIANRDKMIIDRSYKFWLMHSNINTLSTKMKATKKQNKKKSTPRPVRLTYTETNISAG